MSERAILTDLESGSLKHCKFIVSLFHELTVESRFLEPPGETQIGSRSSRNRRWHQITLNWPGIV